MAQQGEDVESEVLSIEGEGSGEGWLLRDQKTDQEGSEDSSGNNFPE